MSGNGALAALLAVVALAGAGCDDAADPLDPPLDVDRVNYLAQREFLICMDEAYRFTEYQGIDAGIQRIGQCREARRKQTRVGR